LLSFHSISLLEMRFAGTRCPTVIVIRDPGITGEETVMIVGMAAGPMAMTTETIGVGIPAIGAALPLFPLETLGAAIRDHTRLTKGAEGLS
jgi:hypothetical protein